LPCPGLAPNLGNPVEVEMEVEMAMEGGQRPGTKERRRDFQWLSGNKFQFAGCSQPAELQLQLCPTQNYRPRVAWQQCNAEVK